MKFTPEGGHVEVSLASDDAKATLRVRDDGIGIDSDALPHVFEPFMQADATLDRSRGGLGLGLSGDSRDRRAAGSVQSASAGLGKGAEFTVTLPLDAALPTSDVEGPMRPPERRRVLVIEDSRDTAESLRQVLTLMGQEVHVASDGPTGIEMGRELRPHVVLCDIGLPG